jgi:hypothetical protein
MYAGTYVYGRTKRYRIISPTSSGEVLKRVRPVKIDGWDVLIRNHHTGYISWAKYLDNQKNRK